VATIDSANLFLQASDDRKDVKPSVVAQKSLVRSPPNLAIYNDQGQPHEVLEKVIKISKDYLSAYQNQWTPLQKKWERSDELYWMAQKESRMPELTLAKVSASVFYRTARRLSDGAYIATYQGDDIPVKFAPDVGVFDDPDTKQRKAIVAEGLNRWGSYCMRKTGLRDKAKKSFNFTYKYGNHIAYVPYDFEVERVKKYTDEDPNIMESAADGTLVYKHKRTGDYSVTPHAPETYEVEYDKITKDEVGFYPRNIDQCYFDNRIEDLDRQTCFMDRTDITRPELWAKGKAGIFKNLDKITELQKFNQYDWSNTAELQRIRDSGKTTTDSYKSEMYEHWSVWLLLPKIEVKLNKKGEAVDMTWDQNAPSRRYVLDIIGRLNDAGSIAVRFSESPYWSNGIPYISAHSHEDDSGWWHRGLLELLDDNILQEQVAKGQLMDNSTLINRRPMVRVIGRCRTKDMRIGVNKVFDVTSPDALQFMTVQDQTANLNNRIEFLKKDSEDIAQTPPFMLGEGIGGRASATEFAAIRDQSSTPALNDIKSINLQINGGYMRKVKEYAPQFLDKNMAIDIDGPNGEKFWFDIKPDDFNMDLDIQEVAIQEFQNKATMRQLLLNLTQLVASPAFAPFINVVGYLERVFSTFSDIFPNPEEILNKDQQVQMLLQQYLTQAAPSQGQPPNQIGAGVQPNLMGLPTAPQGLQLDGIADASGLASAGGAARGA
jgi:hypothetical protein